MTQDSYDITKILDGETADFRVKSTAPMPSGKSLSALAFGLFMTSATAYAFYASGCGLTSFLDCLVSENLFLYFIAFLLLVVGLVAILIGVKNLLKDGPIVIGTSKRLILIYPEKVESIAWNLFIGDITVKGDHNRGTITLKKRTGRYTRNDDNSEKFVPDEVYMVNIDSPREIEKICRQRLLG